MGPPVANNSRCEVENKMASLEDRAALPVPPPPSGENSGLTRWERVAFTLAHAVSSALLRVLTLRGLYAFGAVLGTAEWIVNFKRRRRFHSALEVVLGRRPTRGESIHWARRFFVQSRCSKLFYLVFDRIPPSKATQLFSIKHRQRLDEALARGNGAYVALSHHGPHHVAGLLMAIMGYKIAGVRDRSEGAMRRFIQERFSLRYPEFQKARVVFADAFPREIYRCFKEGYVLGSAMDVHRTRHPMQKTETVAIFGQERDFISGPLRIALRCGAPVLQAAILADGGFNYTLDFEPLLLDSAEAGDEDAAVARTLQTYAANVERHMRERPDLMTRV
jgi:lauroyl/myristoyl acyltransferase